MTPPMSGEALAEVLRIAFRHRIVEPNAEAGFERFRLLSHLPLAAAAFHATIARCVADRLVHDPVRLPEGALQCHWRLELTSEGVNTLRNAMPGVISATPARSTAESSAPTFASTPRLSLPRDEALPPFYHGTSVRSALSLLNGAPLSVSVASANKIDGPPGFYLATEWVTAEFFAVRRAPGTILRYAMTGSVLTGLLADGALLVPIPQGNFPTPFPGEQLVVPPVRFPHFNALRDTGAITVSP